MKKAGASFFVLLLFLPFAVEAAKVPLPRGYVNDYGNMISRAAGAALAEGVKKGRACNTLCQAIQDTGQLLSTHFPTIAGDTNELSDAVIIEQVKKWSPTD
ncbi:MAG: hypothetical protein A2026_17580 [Deltaproteobacteria bacterium RBG_19FT_COMBO_46_12]|nr:MAG: hypothetical protein A2026_17580 [Deltaproteobacteria bacterium RBG_19FT_COMBO_46_12]